MSLTTVRAKSVKATENVDAVVQRVRQLQGVHRVLVIYEQDSATIYYDRERIPGRRRTRRSEAAHRF